MNKLLTSEKGWLLVDSLVGMVILTTAILALASTYIMSSKNNVYAKNYGQALAIAQTYVENHKSVNNTSFTPATSFTIYQQTVNNVLYTVTPTPAIATTDSLGTLIVPVQITVSWNEQNGNKQISVVSYYYYAK